MGNSPLGDALTVKGLDQLDKVGVLKESSTTKLVADPLAGNWVPNRGTFCDRQRMRLLA